MALLEVEVYRINDYLVNWVKEIASITKPKEIIWCDGSDNEYKLFINQMLKNGTLVKLNQEKYPNCYLHRSHPKDVARTEEATYICTKNKEDAGPTNNWMDPKKAKELLFEILKGCMKYRKMYVVPYLMGPKKSPYSQVGVQITDSLYVVVSLKIMTRMGKIALDHLGDSKNFIKGIHSMVNLDPKKKYICHFPEERLIISVNSNYGGNALLSKKCHSLRIASAISKEEGWMAEHMLIIEIEEPNGNKTYITGAFPSASGKTNVAMLKPPKRFKDWKVWTIGDDIAWMHIDKEGNLRAINPEYGFFGVAPGTNPKTNPNILITIRKNTIFTNVALTKHKTPWWEGLTEEIPDELIDWQGRKWNKKGHAAHPNSRFTTPILQYPFVSSKFEDPNGVPISIIMFGGRRTTTIPLVYESFNWKHGVLMGAMMRVETTAAAEGKVGMIRNDPMAMKPFCGYNMADYFRHWLEIGNRIKNKPRIFYVNWFKKGNDGKYLWPGFGENLRVIKWMIERIKGKSKAVETPIGYVPTIDSLDLEGLNISEKTIQELLKVDPKEWIKELNEVEKFFKIFRKRFPEELWKEFYKIKERIEKYL